MNNFSLSFTNSSIRLAYFCRDGLLISCDILTYSSVDVCRMTPAVENPPAEEEANAEGKKNTFCLRR